MPRKSTVATESMWVPQAARAVCYSCGTKFTTPPQQPTPGGATAAAGVTSNNREKFNCHLCFDVFCSRCMPTKRLLPVHYGYTDPQPVCITCNLLLTSFVRFAAQVHKRGAGILLPPREAVMIASCNLPPCANGGEGGASAQQKKGKGGSPEQSGEEGSWLSRLFRRMKGDEGSTSPRSASPSNGSNSNKNNRKSMSAASSGSSGGRGSPTVRTEGNDASSHQQAASVSSYCNIPQAVLASRSVQVRDACSLFMVGWRPLNVATAIVVGQGADVHLFLKDIVRVTIGGGGINGSVQTNEKYKRMSVSPSNPQTPSAAAAAQKNFRHTVMLTPTSAKGGAGGGSSDVGGGESSFNDGRVTIELRGGYYCQLLVGLVELAPRRSSAGSNTSDNTDDEVDTIEDFTSDPNAAQQLVERLSTLIKHAKQHFALSQANLALHADLCPT